MRAASLKLLGLCVPLCVPFAGNSVADEAETWAVHGQTTLVIQGTPSFRSPYQGPNSLAGAGELSHTLDATLYAGFRPWTGAELWINPEIEQGFALSRSQGVAGFPNGEGSKVGSNIPYAKLQRLFLRQTLGLGGESTKIEAGPNQLAGTQLGDRVVLTVGKLSVVDIFDSNKYAHDPRSDFLNLGIVDTGSFDFAANAWGYTVGASAELYRSDWAVRAGLFDMSKVPNGKQLDPTFRQTQAVVELERRHAVFDQPGSIRFTAFASRANMARYSDALGSGPPVDLAPFRRFRSRFGAAVNLDQQVMPFVGMFLRAGLSDGKLESYEFTDVDRTIAVGVLLDGERWGRRGDSIGASALANSISRSHQAYLDGGGLGLYVGDGMLPRPGIEKVGELFYKLALTKGANVTFDYQLVSNPGYNRDRGPVSVFGTRLHAEF